LDGENNNSESNDNGGNPEVTTTVEIATITTHGTQVVITTTMGITEDWNLDHLRLDTQTLHSASS